MADVLDDAMKPDFLGGGGGWRCRFIFQAVVKDAQGLLPAWCRGTKGCWESNPGLAPSRKMCPSPLGHLPNPKLVFLIRPHHHSEVECLRCVENSLQNS